MFNLLKIEFYKLKKSKMFYFFLLLTILQAAVVYVFTTHGYSQNLSLMSGKQTLLYMFMIQSNLSINIFIGVFASDYIVTEFTSGYIKNLISYGHNRKSIFIAKTMVYYVSVIIISFIVPVIMAVINTVRNGYGEVFTFNSLIYLIMLAFTMSIIHISIGSISALGAFAFRNVNITMSIAVALDFINRILNIMFIQNPLKLVKWIFNNSAVTQVSIILQDNAGVAEFLHAGVISLITILVTTIAGIYIFEKADIK